MDTINIDYLKKIVIKIGTVVKAEMVEKSEKLIKLTVSFGKEERIILSGIAKFYSPQSLVGRQMPFILNLEERDIMGEKSQGMLFAVDNNGDAVLLLPDKYVENGAPVI